MKKFYSMKAIITSILLLAINVCIGQTTSDSSSTKTNKVILKKEYGIDKVINTYSKTFEKEGYRVQIFSGNKRQPAKEAKATYIRMKLEAKAHEVYQQPYFKVRVGDFRTKIEALKFQKELLKEFPNSFIVKDKIEVEELLNN